MIAVEFVKPDTAEPDAALTNALATAAHAAGVIVLTAGTFGNVVRFLPPLTISDELLTEGLDVADRSAGRALKPTLTDSAVRMHVSASRPLMRLTGRIEEYRYLC